MHDIILHHYEFSTFSEKVRIALGLKQLAWRSVDIPGLPPRPLLSPLTGGYRRAPVMQVGADIYCDTHAILAALERMRPEPSLFPAGSLGLARGLGFAWERQMWIPTIGVLVHYIGEHIPPEFLKDRKEGYLGVDISKDAMAPQFEEHVQFVRAQVAWLAQALTPEAYIRLGGHFGEMEKHEFFPHIEGHPQIQLISHQGTEAPETDRWHTDVTFRKKPNMVSILRITDLPPSGGDTMWMHAGAAFDALNHCSSPRSVAARRGKKVSDVIGRKDAAAEARE